MCVCVHLKVSAYEIFKFCLVPSLKSPLLPVEGSILIWRVEQAGAPSSCLRRGSIASDYNPLDSLLQIEGARA